MLRKVSRGFRQDIPPATPPALGDIIQRCWAQNPSNRPVMADVLTELASLIIELEDAEASLSSGPTLVFSMLASATERSENLYCGMSAQQHAHALVQPAGACQWEHTRH